MDNRTRLLRGIFSQGFRTPDWRHKQPLPVVSLEEFFEQNDDPESFAVNLQDHPGLEFFYDKLKSIRAEADVNQVLVSIYDLEPILAGGWPFSQNAHILTSANAKRVQSWAASLRANGGFKGWPVGVPHAAAKEGGAFLWWSIAWR